MIINELWIAFKDTNSLILALIPCIHLTQNRTAPLYASISDGPLNRCIVFHYSISRKDHILLLPLRFAIELRETRSNIYFIKFHIYVLMNGLLFLLSSSHPIHTFHLDPRERKEEIFHQTSFIKLFSWNNSSKRL